MKIGYYLASALGIYMSVLQSACLADISNAMDGAIFIKSQESVTAVPIRKTEHHVKWLDKGISVDGNQSDWESAGVPAVDISGTDHATWFKGRYGGADDFALKFYVARDYDNLYFAVELKDDKAPAANRVEVAFTEANTPVISGWRDVGERYLDDDLHIVFTVGSNGVVGMHFPKIQDRMDRDTVQNSYGSEAERRAILEQDRQSSTSFDVVIAKAGVKIASDGSSVTFMEAAVPWKSLLPYDPVKGGPLGINVGAYDTDTNASVTTDGALAWRPGLIGTISGAHFPVLVFDPPAATEDLMAYAQVAKHHYVNSIIKTDISISNNGKEGECKLELFDVVDKTKPLASKTVELKKGYNSTSLEINSEDVGKGVVKLMLKLIPQGGKTVEIPVFSPGPENFISVISAHDIESRIAALRQKTEALSNLCARVEAAGLDTTYPIAYRTLFEMFVERSLLDFKIGDSDRVFRNTDYLDKVYARATEYINGILQDPSKQLIPAPDFDPEKLKISDGYWRDGDRPVFLWGPCVFWYLINDTPKVSSLGFNSVCPEVRTGEKEREKADAHMEFWRTNNIHVNVAVSAPDLMLTGADVKASKLLREHPELKNMDPNNFMSFVVQMPVVRTTIDEEFNKHIEFWKRYKGINSYWLWNEPWYTNYSETTRRDFINAMRRKYSDISNLNARWKSSYKSFDEIQLIKWPDPKNYAPWYDFQKFRDDLLFDFFDFLNKTSKKYNPQMPTHTKFMAASLHSFDIERLQSIYDIAGHDGSPGDRDIIFLDFCKSVYPEKPLSDTEVHLYYGGKDVLENSVWRLALHGLANGNWWCWHSNPGFSDSIANAMSMDALAFSGLDINRLFVPHLISLIRQESPIATLFPEVVERISDVKMVRMRYEAGVSFYMLGINPFYVTAKTIENGELNKHKVLFAPESRFVTDKTYRDVLEYVRGGGMLVVTKGGFSTNEYGDRRDASELVREEGGDEYCEGARIYEVGKGKVICIDEVECLPDPVPDGGICMRGSPTEENDMRRRVYVRVLSKIMSDNGLNREVRLMPAKGWEDDEDALYGYDWRVERVGDAYTICILPYSAKDVNSVRLETSRPIKRIVDLITGKDVPIDKFSIKKGANLFSIELEK